MDASHVLIAHAGRLFGKCTAIEEVTLKVTYEDLSDEQKVKWLGWKGKSVGESHEGNANLRGWIMRKGNGSYA